MSDARYILCHGRLSQYLESFEDAFIGEVEATVAMMTVLLGGFVEGTLLGNVSLFMALVADVVAASASKERTLNQTTVTWGQGHPIFGCCMHRGVGHMCVSYLFQCLYLLHPPLYPIHLHVDGE